jgi:phosphoribosylaminoimidazole-succinocarboxamide synthase
VSPSSPVELPLVHRGKVRDVYDAGPGRLLLVATDRVSAFDVVMAEEVPDKGRVLCGLSAWWFTHLAGVAPSHLLSTDPADFPPEARREDLAGRSMLVQRADMVPLECVVRGHLAGSGWAEYRRSGQVQGHALPAGLREAEALPEPLFTPTTKGDPGVHDEPLTWDEAVALVGRDVAERCRAITLAVFAAGVERAAAAGLVLADTKLELGWVDGELVVADELLTPDSSRLWEAAMLEPGRTPASFDKQPLRDWLDAQGWDHSPPPPPLPPEVVEATRARYVDAYERLTGERFASAPGAGATMAP